MPPSGEHYEALLQKYLEGQCTSAEAEDLLAWLRTSAAHRPLLEAMQRKFEQTMGEPHEVPAALSHRIETRLLQDISRNKVAKLPARTRWRWVAAAVVLLALGSAYLYYTSRPAGTPVALNKPANGSDVAPGSNKAVLTLANGATLMLDSAGNQVIQQGRTTVRQFAGQLQYAANGNSGTAGFNTLAVPRGGQFKVVLPDGSRVWLNAASSLKYPTAFTGKERVVELQGQGYFEVAKNARQPFTVKVSNMDVQVLGTRFDIMAYADEKSINTTLLEGAVRVRQGNVQQLLKPGQQATLSNGVITVQAADVEQVIAWKTGFFEFDNANLADILRQLSRWYDIEVSYQYKDNGRLFGGRISRNLPLSEILHMLEANGARFSLEGRKLLVTFAG